MFCALSPLAGALVAGLAATCLEPELEHAAVSAKTATMSGAEARRESGNGFTTNRPSFEDRLRDGEQASGLAFPASRLGAAVPLRDSAGISPVFAASAPSRERSRDGLNLAACGWSGAPS